MKRGIGVTLAVLYGLIAMFFIAVVVLVGFTAMMRNFNRETATAWAATPGPKKAVINAMSLHTSSETVEVEVHDAPSRLVFLADLPLAQARKINLGDQVTLTRDHPGQGLTLSLKHENWTSTGWRVKIP